MSLSAAKMGSLKDQLLEEERALKAELAAVEKDVKKSRKSKKDD
jgi:hypothetical protein